NFKSEQGQQADFIPIVAWGQVAKLLQIYCEKGDLVGLTGRIQSRSYLSKEEETIFVVELLVDEVDFLQGKRSTTSASSSFKESKQHTSY
ncbi:single-stranded DNA-binding protein, partial [Carnobacterium sp.]|uniref:single-stranded DNA-binding protein n=1 Tax=Carnobacterium sp. TaxID=48221 RepID=UPI0028A940D3